MDHPIRTLSPDEFPLLLREIPDAPTQLFVRGSLPDDGHTLLTVVGSRKYTAYGRQVTEALIGSLRGQPVSIVSGLALGIDSIAHRAALAAGLHTVAIPGSGLDDRVIYPRAHARLAREILAHGGALLSEFVPDFEATPWCFPQRNRIVAGIAHATLVIEASLRSGTLITARLATEYNRDVLAVPGSIFAAHSEGPHALIRVGATPVCSAYDLAEALGLQLSEQRADTYSPEEKTVMDLLAEPRAKDELCALLDVTPQEANVLLSMMELRGYIRIHAGMCSRRM